MSTFKLSAQLTGHSQDVRAVSFPNSKFALSASRDGTVRVWRRTTASPPAFEDSIIAQGSDFVNTLTYLAPGPDFTEGLVLSGGKETIIDARKPDSGPTDDAYRLLLGHANNICTLDVSPDDKWLVSGGWDGQARVWPVGKWETELMLDGHNGKSVWAVLAWSHNTVVTGCADEKIRIYKLSSAKAGEVSPANTIHTTDVIRALCKVPPNHPSGADIASASNDGVIRLWKLTGQLLGELHGHDSFVYSLAPLPTGEIASSGEDRTVRIWKGTECIQTITHPAISVWAVSACQETGDLVTGASDSFVRIFTRSSDRFADADSLRQFDDAVKSSAIPAQSQGTQINKEKLPGPEFLTTKSGTKEGQVQMIKEDNGSVTAHQWSMGQQQWINVGTVVDAVGSSGKKVEYKGKMYDYVFDVDIEDGKPPLKLPYNLSQNPYEAATKFLGDNELPLSYLDQAANFITQNTQGATLGQTTQQAGPDPYGTESRYQPGGSQSQTPKVLPHKDYVTLIQAKFEPIQRKILSVNQTMISSGSKDVALNPMEEQTLKDLIEAINSGRTNTTRSVSDAQRELVYKMALRWPYGDRLPALDLLRCIAQFAPVAAHRDPSNGSVIDVALASAFETGGPTVSDNCAMMALRVMANVFATQGGQEAAAQGADRAVAAMERVVGLGRGAAVGTGNRNVMVALATAALNYAVLAAKTKGQDAVGPEARLLLANVLGKVVSEQLDAEVAYRSLVALGTLLVVDADEAKALGARGWVDAALEKASEERVRAVARECLEMLR